MLGLTYEFSFLFEAVAIIIAGADVEVLVD